jgi:alanine racemase
MLSACQLTSQSSRRGAWVEIDLDNLERNIEIVKSWLGLGASAASSAATLQADAASASERARFNPLLMGVVKADAYGHGAVVVSEILQQCGASWLGVATVDEGIELRENGIELPILTLGPVFPAAIKVALENSLDITISAQSQLKDLLKELAHGKREARIHLKVDTGMRRLGVSPKEVDTIIDEIKQHSQIRLVSIFSHLAKAAEEKTTTAQNLVFLQVIKKARAVWPGSCLFHLASSEATRLYPFTHHDMVRVGLALYGLEAKEESKDLLPVLSLRGLINQLKEIEPGDYVGYGHTWGAKTLSKLASVPIGYADGVDRGLSNRLEGILNGKLVPQVGVISMDQMIFDVTDVPNVRVGDVITLIGSQPLVARAGREGGVQSLTLADWAKKLETITYELAVKMKLRLPRKFVRAAAEVKA